MPDDQTPQEIPTNTQTPVQPVFAHQQPPLEPLSMPAAITPAPTMSPARKNKRLKLIMVVALIVFVVAAGSAAGYFGYIAPNKPENIFKAALGNALTDPAGHSKGELEISSQETTTIASFESAMDAEQKLAQLAFELTTSGLSLPAEIRYVDESIFVMIGDISALRTLAQLTGIDSASLDELFATAERTVVDKWIEIDKTVLGQSEEAKCVLAADWTLSESDAALLQAAYAQNEFAVITSHSDDTVDGRAAIKYELDLDAAKAKEFSNDKKLEDLSLVKRLNDCAKTQAKEETENVEDQVSDGLEDATIAVWVDKDTKRFSRYVVTSASEGTEVAVDATLGYGPVSVKKPEGATPIMDVIAEFQRVLGQGGIPAGGVLGIFDEAGLN